MKLIRERVQEKIAAIEAQMAARQEQIVALEAANTADEEQITDLRAKETAVEKALEAIAGLDPLLLTGPVEKTDKSKRTPGVRKLVLDMLEEAGLPGLSVEEIIKHAQAKMGLVLNVGSIRSVIYKASQDGKVEQRPDKHWRLRPNAHQPPAPSDLAGALRH